MIRLLWSAMDSALYPVLMVMAMWITYLFNIDYNWHLEEYGLKPHLIGGLLGILTMPFLHENLEHLFSNSIPLLVAGSFLFYYFKNWTWLIGSVVWIGGGGILWFIGEQGTNHIGASGLIYGLVFFLLVSGIIRGHRHLAAVALLMVFLYGSLVWGLFPDYVELMQENISWEGHLGGALMGSLMSFLLLKKGPQKEVYQEDEDEGDEHEIPYWMNDEYRVEPLETDKTDTEPTNDEPILKYRYVPKNANPWEKDD
ncbi:MAG: rhomboid family intramembrane serine protease [Bacteroidia bacterium]